MANNLSLTDEELISLAKGWERRRDPVRGALEFIRRRSPILLPCPFCGAAPPTVRLVLCGEDGLYVGCGDGMDHHEGCCGARSEGRQGWLHGTPHDFLRRWREHYDVLAASALDVSEAWNRRAS